MCAGQQITAPEPEIIAELVEEEVIAGPAAAGSVVISHQLERLICVAEVVGQ